MDLRTDLANLQQSQSALLSKLAQKEDNLCRQQQRQESFNNQAKHSLASLKEFYTAFAEECKTQWIGIYQQLFQLFYRTVQVYQIKVQKLEEEVAARDQRIKQLENEPWRLECYDNSSYEPLWQQNSSSAGKRIKISDMIAINSHNYSVSTPVNEQADITEKVQENQKGLQEQKALLDITDQINRKLFNRCLQKQTEKLWDKDVSPILSASPDKGALSPASDFFQQKKMSAQVNKENKTYFVQSVKMSKNGDSWKNPPASTSTSGMKLNQLRKTLIQRKKSDQLYP